MNLGSRVVLKSAMAWLILMELNYVMTRPSEDTCKLPNLARGTIKTRQRNKLLRFSCMLGFRLLGDKYARCVNGSWDVEMPVCIKRGCQLFPALSNGMQYYLQGNALVMFFCIPGYKIEGAATAYCDGRRWNGTQPSCVADTETTISLSCDFESEDICGWTHDPNHDFDWRRQNLKTPSGHMKTGPSFDHTLGEGKNGYYMYIESTSRLVNDTARLISPVYPAALSKDACFSFFYHMYGRTTGYLIVYLHPQSVEFSSIQDNAEALAKYTMFKKYGDQGDQWLDGFFSIEEMQENFQIVIEGVRGPGYVSDIAIDDVSLMQGEKCIEKRKTLTTTPLYSSFDSCLNRCNSTKKISFMAQDECECTEYCLENGTCCVDYKDLCVFGDVSEFSIYVDYDTTSPPPLPTSQMMTAKKITDYNPTNQDTIDYFEYTTEDTKIIPTAEVSLAKTNNPILSETVSVLPTFADAKLKFIITTPKFRPTIPKISFITPSLPLINATGILTKVTRLPKLMNITKKIVSTTLTTTVETDMEILKLNSTTTDRGETFFNPEIEVSKTYMHYGRNEHGNSTIIETATKIATVKKIRWWKPEPRPEESISMIGWIGIIVSLTIIITLIIGRKQLRASFNSNVLPIFSRKLSIRSYRNSQNSDSGDMRFLVQDQELEHDID